MTFRAYMIGFNGRVRGLGFALGLIAGGAFIGLGQLVYPGLAVPLAFASLAAVWLNYHRWVPFGYAALMGSGVVLLWLRSTNSRTDALVLRAGGLPILVLVGLIGLGSLVVLIHSLRQPPKTSRTLLAFLGLLLLTTWLVAYFSSDKGGADPMLRWLESLGLSPDQAYNVNYVFRKGVHLSFYAANAAFAFRAAHAAKTSVREAWIFSLVFTLVLASFDEGRQSFSAARSGSAWDVLLDMCGAAAGCWLVSRLVSSTKSARSRTLRI